jgi:hypothetical protein
MNWLASPPDFVAGFDVRLVKTKRMDNYSRLSMIDHACMLKLCFTDYDQSSSTARKSFSGLAGQPRGSITWKRIVFPRWPELAFHLSPSTSPLETIEITATTCRFVILLASFDCQSVSSALTAIRIQAKQQRVVHGAFVPIGEMAYLSNMLYR